MGDSLKHSGHTIKEGFEEMKRVVTDDDAEIDLVSPEPEESAEQTTIKVEVSTPKKK